MKENKVKKIEILDANELEDVAGGRAYNEAWECPKCGYVIYLTHYNANFGVQQHLETHGFVGYGVDYGEDFWKRDN